MGSVGEAKVENRRAPRVAAGRPGRLHCFIDGNEISITCNAVDLSVTGCRILFSREMLPSGKIDIIGIEGEMRCNLDAKKCIRLPMKVLWSQHFKQNMIVAGAKFKDVDPHYMEQLDEFVLNRLRAGLELYEENSGKEKDVAASQIIHHLSTPIEVESGKDNEKLPHPYRFGITSVGYHYMHAEYMPREGEEKLPPEEGAIMDLTVFPPSWAGVELRALRFAAKVQNVTPEGVDFVLPSSGHDICQMVCSMLPEHEVNDDKSKEINYYYILIVIAAIIIWLIATI
jgi:hypothetical protein